MSKYIIELGEDAKAIQSISVTSLGNVYVDSWYVENLEELNSDYINEHFGELQDTAYQKGFEDGVTKRTDGDTCIGCKLQGTDSNICDQCCNSYANQWTAKDDKIEVGDEVVGTAGHRGFVTKPINSESVYVVWEDGSCGANDLKDLKKTGRTRYDIEKILEAMKE